MRSVRIFAVAFLTWCAVTSADAAKKKTVPRAESTSAVMWRDPADIASRNLYYGSGGEAQQPHGPYTFVKEDLDGTNPKFSVRDGRGEKWKVKLGIEARSEVVASRLVWASGYLTDDDYFVPDLLVAEMPRKLHRGQELIGAGGIIARARFERELAGKHEGYWRWKHNPFVNTREWNGLRALMALINNWDLKDVNTAIHRDGPQEFYIISDLGATFGPPGLSFPKSHSRDDLAAYAHSKFITHSTEQYVDFAAPARPSWEYAFAVKNYFSRLHMEWIGRHVPREDARWIGEILARLRPAQVVDAFRGAGYSDEEARAYSRVVEERISALAQL